MQSFCFFPFCSLFHVKAVWSKKIQCFFSHFNIGGSYHLMQLSFCCCYYIHRHIGQMKKVLRAKEKKNTTKTNTFFAHTSILQSDKVIWLIERLVLMSAWSNEWFFNQLMSKTILLVPLYVMLPLTDSCTQSHVEHHTF